MHLGFVSAILHDLDLEDVLRFASEERFDSVEVMCWPQGRADRKYAGVTHIDVAALDDRRAAEIGELCARLNVRLSGLGYYPNPLSGDVQEAEVAREHLRRVIASAPKLGLTNVNTFIGADHRRDSEYNLARFREVWPPLIRWAEEHRVRIGIENCPMLFSADEWPGGKNLAVSPAIWHEMFAAIPSDHFGLNYDPSHMVWQMMDYVAPIYELGHKLFHTHAKDMRVERSKLDRCGILGQGWSTPKIPGLGQIDWARFVSALTDVGYHGAVAIEVEDEAFLGNLESRKNSLRIARNVLRPLIVGSPLGASIG